MALRCVVLISLCASVCAIVGPNITKTVHKTDTYLEAYSKSRVDAEKAEKGVIIITAKDGEKKINRDDSYTGYDYSPPYSSDHSSFSGSSSGFSGPSNNYLPPSSYGPPVKFESEITYNAPTNSYGPPAHSYSPPEHSYGPPSYSYGPQNYGPPSHTYGPPAPVYGPPKPIYGPPFKPTYGVPYTAPGLGFLDKLSLKLDLLTIAKLLLKFLIIKKVLTTIAVVCMWLVLPKLISFKKDDTSSTSNDEEDYRSVRHTNMVELSSIQQLFDRAVAVYGRQPSDCGVVCRVRSVMDDLFDFQPYYRRQPQPATSTQ